MTLRSPAIKQADASGRVGFYGCGGIVRVGVPAGVIRPPALAVVDCPCGNRHRVAISWRAPTALDRGRKPDLILDVAPPEPSPPNPTQTERTTP